MPKKGVDGDMVDLKGNEDQDGVTAKQPVRRKVNDGLKLVASIWGLAAALSLGLAVSYQTNVTNTRFKTFSPADMIDLGRTLGGFTTRLCQSVSINAYQKFDAYRLQQAPQTDRISRDKYNFTQNVDSKYDIHDRSFYLLGGSVVNIGACIYQGRHNFTGNETIMKVFVFKGDAFGDSANICPSCAIQVHDVDADMICQRHKRLEFSLVVQETDDYYFRYSFTDSPQYYKLYFVEFSYQINSVRYDLSSAEVACRGQTSCDVTFDYATNQGVVLQFNEFQGSHIHLQSSCNKRAFYWGLMFGVIPVAIATFLSCCCYCLYRTHSNERPDVALETEANVKDQQSNDSFTMEKDSTSLNAEG